MSLLEIMVAVSILSIVVALGIPSYVQWNRFYQLRAATTDLAADLNMLRMAAMNRNALVTMTVGPIPCPPETTSCGENGASFATVIPPRPFRNGITVAFNPPGTTVQFNSLGLRSGGPAGTQVITLTNTDGITYSIAVTPGGKVRWCAASTCG